jgi:hypothetical protein
LDVDATEVSGIWWRQVPASVTFGQRPIDAANNRWQRGSVVDALYFAESEETVWAEWYRYLAEAGLAPQAALPRGQWRWEISLGRVADLSDQRRLARVGLPATRPTREQWPEFQAVGETLHREGWAAVLSASAARREGRVLCAFRTERVVAGTRPLPPPVTVSEAPVVPTGLRT